MSQEFPVSSEESVSNSEKITSESPGNAPHTGASASVNEDLNRVSSNPNNVESRSATAQFRDAIVGKRAGLDDFDPEDDIWQGGFSPKAMIGFWLLAILASVGVIVAVVMVPQITWMIGLIAILLVWMYGITVYGYRRLGIHYKLTTQRFIHKSGLLRRVTDRIEVIDINDVNYEQGPIQRLFGVGTIRLSSSDRTHPSLTMLGIDNVEGVAGLIDDIRRKERKRRSLHIETS